MRTRLHEVKDYEGLRDWAIDSPWFNHPFKNIGVLLFSPGHGMLRWGIEVDEIGQGWYEPPEPIALIPPARMVWIWVSARVHWAARAGGWFREEELAFDPYPTVRPTNHSRWTRIKYRNWVPSMRDLWEEGRDPGFPHDYLYG